MKLTRLNAITAALVLSIASLLTLTFPQIASALGPYTCTWTGSGDGTSFNSAANWSGCNSSFPQPSDNDNLVFGTTSTVTTLNNNISGLNVGSITVNHSGSNNSYYNITGNDFNLGGGITLNSSSIDFSVNVTLTADQAFSGATLLFGSNNTLNVGAYNLTDSLANQFINSLSGSGSITISGGVFQIEGASPSYSGTITVDSNATLQVQIDSSSNNLGTGQTIIDSGGTLGIQGNNDTDTLKANIEVDGDGIGGYGAITSCLGLGGSCEGDGHNTTLTLSGLLTLTGDTQIANGAYFPSETQSPSNSATFNLADVTLNGFTLTDPSGSNTVINNETPTPAATQPSAKAPNTGFGLTSFNITLPITGSIITLSGIYLIYRRTKSPVITKK